MNRQNFIRLLLSSFIVSVGGESCQFQSVNYAVLIVSLSAMYRNAFEEIVQLYKQQKPNIKIILNIGASGFLRQQIEQGVPSDIYISGSEVEMKKLQSLGLILPETLQVLTTNQMALIVPKNSQLSLSKFEDLLNPEVKTIAIGSQQVAVGIYTEQVLNYYKIYEPIIQKSVQAGQEVRQVLRYVESTQNVDAGITYITEAKLSNQVKVVAIAPEASHEPIITPVAVLKRCNNVPEALDFVQFLKSNQPSMIFKKYGFTIVK